MIFDYIWKSLFFSAVSGSIALAMILAAGFALRRVSAGQRKWYFNLQILILLTLFAGSFLTAAIDRQMLAGCFDAFVKESASWTVTRWISAFWILGMAALLIGDGVRAYLAFRHVRRYGSVTDHGLLALFDELKLKVGVRTPVDLCVADDVHSPVASGFFTHRVIVPRVSFSEQVMKSILAHELAHVRDRDSVFLALELLCRRVFFWNPLAYVFANVYALSVETAADEAAVSGAVTRSQFASSLVEVAAAALTPSLSPGHVPASRGYREARARLEFLSRAPASGSFASVLMLAVLAVAPVAISLAQAQTLTQESYDPKMCVQVKHEQLIESWLRIESAPPLKCEQK